MDKPQKLDTPDQADFVLKHRVVGAGILLMFGALILPWLLGPPTAANKTASTADIGAQSQANLRQSNETQDKFAGSVSVSESIEDELLAAIEAEDDDTLEQVYISKITPLDNKPASARVEPAKPKSATAEQKLQKTLEKIAETDKKSNSPSVDKVVKKDAVKPSKALAVAKPSKKEPSEKKPKDEVKVKRSVNTPASDAVAKTKPVQDKVKLELGWVVQVGVFTDPKGAQKVVQDLESKGFKPDTSVVDTNRGKGTGTRVWLGPFAQRVDAAKTKTRLKNKTGEPGFIRAYP